MDGSYQHGSGKKAEGKHQTPIRRNSEGRQGGNTEETSEGKPKGAQPNQYGPGESGRRPRQAHHVTSSDKTETGICSTNAVADAADHRYSHQSAANNTTKRPPGTACQGPPLPKLGLPRAAKQTRKPAANPSSQP
ncbi:unnamed protein product [Pleuronectes platessa]|uniref:Uncharacterized protein n=1 Tax=Pleuronectes platessa TaxID=8262 RepID=A0A9N7TJJ2_PLEPL|nr:unnamed protein product [Pleuronectes platessa]